MDIDYDPTEEEADDVDGLLDFDPRREVWTISCPEHGLVDTSPDGSAASHDAMVRRWTQHMQEEHHGDGIMTVEDRMMLIEPDEA